ncbi:MAG TPA: UDP-N-acetylmuramoyl-L-alanyl-D-glutamate--2,6-diaminopimelate ligase [Caulifigura sp.]|nr:UDP-N-acetylmuramoyl-L-alanyl-D-glutamate--2,6-diaminopimelate ligase [Caulifigura sp.]
MAVAEATEDSRLCTPGCLFAAIPGTKQNGQHFVEDALSRGAAVILTSQPLAKVKVNQCIVGDVRAAYSELCQALAGMPSRRLGLVGVTGTNGKTTTTWLVRAILEANRKHSGLLGTVEYSDGITTEPATLTTPDSRALSDWLASMVSKKTAYAAIELSSHALQQSRAAGVQLDVAVVTNITRDHFDFHGSYENYRIAKARLLWMLKRGGVVVLNADSVGSASLAELVPSSSRMMTFGIENDADVSCRLLEESQIGSRFVVEHGAEEFEFFTPLVGRHNVENCLAAIAACRHFGLSLDCMADGINTLRTVPGRMELIEGRQPFRVLVDYAHTDDALRNVIKAVRPTTRGRVIVVFGAGGDRDAEKRPLMGEAASAADLCVVTSDNPRSEDPDAIITQIAAGIPAGTKKHLEVDRETAIAWAIRHAKPGDTVLVCGKGHEKVQVVGSERIPFDDAAACRQHLFHYRIPRRAAS